VSAPQATVGIIVNPSSGRDIRRLLSRASVFPNGEKINLVLRLLAGLGALGVVEALLMPDDAGIAATIEREASTARKGQPLPHVQRLAMPVEGTADDTRRAVSLMLERGVGAIAVLGGDGTHRVVAGACGQTPLLALSTGTNNAFPELREATTAGLALALLVTGRVPPALGLRRNKLLRVRYRGREELALVDVCVARQKFLGARAVWQPADLSRIFVTFAEPRSLGLTSIVAWSLPVSRGDQWGVQLRFGPGGRSVLAPIAPGLVERIEVAEALRLMPGQPVELPPEAGTVALDGERELELDPAERLTVELDLGGPHTINVDAALAYASRQGLLRV
jgi:predicted polyphosphate/ATP-dependent NAD kinase